MADKKRKKTQNNNDQQLFFKKALKQTLKNISQIANEIPTISNNQLNEAKKIYEKYCIPHKNEDIANCYNMPTPLTTTTMGYKNMGYNIFDGSVNSFNNQSVIKQLSYLAFTNNTIIPLQQYFFFLELSVKNNTFIKAITEIYVNTIIDTFGLEDKMSNSVLTLLYRAVFWANIYGGAYVALDDFTIKVYEPQELVMFQHYFNIDDEKVEKQNRNKIMKLNDILSKVNRSDFETKWLESNNATELSFTDGTKYLSRNVFLIKSLTEPVGMISRNYCCGLNLSFLDGKIPTIIEFNDVVQALFNLSKTHHQLSIQIKNLDDLSAMSSEQQMNNIKDALASAGVLVSNGIIASDVEGKVNVLTSVIQNEEIFQSILIELGTLIFEMPLRYLCFGTRSQYQNKETIEASEILTRYIKTKALQYYADITKILMNKYPPAKICKAK